VVQCRAVSAVASGAAAMNPILRECFNILFMRVSVVFRRPDDRVNGFI